MGPHAPHKQAVKGCQHESLRIRIQGVGSSQKSKEVGRAEPHHLQQVPVRWFGLQHGSGVTSQQTIPTILSVGTKRGVPKDKVCFPWKFNLRVATEETVYSCTVANIAANTTELGIVRPVVPEVRKEGWVRAQETFLLTDTAPLPFHSI